MKMKALLYCLAFLSLISLNLQAQDLSKEEIEEDFDHLLNALEEGHPGLYWYHSKKEFDKKLQKVEAALSEVKNVIELHSLFVEINNTISCGHTAVFLPDAYYAKTDSTDLYLPFNIVLVEGKILVAESFTNDISRGDQVLSINDEPIVDVIKDLQRFIPIDKGITTKRDRSIEITFPYYYAIYKGNPKKFEVDYVNSIVNKKQSKEIAAISWHKNLYKSARDFAPSQIPLTWSIDDEHNLAKIKLATFSGQNFKKYEINFHDTIASIFEILKEKNIENLVIDLRWNNGGTMTFAEYLFSFFIDTTYQYYNDAEIKQAAMEGVTKYGRSRNMKPMMEKQLGALEPRDGVYYLPGEKFMVEPSKPQFKGNLYLLTNGFSFSATSAFISQVQENKVGQIIGETPGGAFNGLNAGPPVIVELPNSKIRLYYRIIGTSYNVAKGKTRTNVDAKIENTADGFLGDQDTQLDYIKSIIKERQKY